VPGGGVHAGESPEAAVRRELMEELGISLQEIKQIGSYSQVIEYKQDTVDVFVGTTASEKIAIDEVELVEAQWFPFDMLPSDRGTQVDRIVAMYRS
jgi:NADH pyrophosphatase NudC (nudix superfamily)